MAQPSNEDPWLNDRWRKNLAWLAHVYTALGLVLAVGMVMCILQGTADGYRWAFALMVVACLVDATDGSLARKLHVKELVPQFDGTKLDDIVDFLTFTSIPLLLIWRAEILPDAAEWVLVVALLASAYGFCQVPAKTIDGYFVGFPSYWNIVAFYLYALQIDGWLAAMIILALAILTFVPSYYLYPSRGAAFSRSTNFLGGVWVVFLALVLRAVPSSETANTAAAWDRVRWLAMFSLFFPAYYMAVSWGITIDRWRRRERL